MDSKKQLASLMEDHSPDPGAEAIRDTGRSGDPFSGQPSSGVDLDLGPGPGPNHSTLSCVTRETSQEDCARHRFIVWAAVKRNSSVRMTPEERLECPLLRCTQRFPDHESMLKHLAGCRYLASGEYWCYDHMRVERFDDLKCKKCLGHPSKRRKMLTMAKSFFQSLGHKAKKSPSVKLVDQEMMLQPPPPPPPSYDSLNIPSADANASELPSTEISEIDSFEVPLLQPTPAPAPSSSINPQALLVPAPPSLPELESNEALTQWQPPVSGFTQPPFTDVACDYRPASATAPPRPPMPGIPSSLNAALNAHLPILAQESGCANPPSPPKPALQLTTAGIPGRRQIPRSAPRPAPAVPRSMGLSPSSSVRSTASTDTTTSTASYSSTLISSASGWSGTWSIASGLDTSMTSPIEACTVTDESLVDVLNCDHQQDGSQGSPHDFFSELPADLPMLDSACDMTSSALLGLDPVLSTNLASAPEIAPADVAAPAVEIGDPEIGQANTCCSETKSLVSSAWDNLQEHIVSSMWKLQGYGDNYLATQLRAMSIKTIATTGLRTLRALIDGQQPSSASDALCLIHLIYSFFVVVRGQETSNGAKRLFQQSLAYANGLPPNERTPYRQLVVAIWEPPGFSSADTGVQVSLATGSPSSGLSPNHKGKSLGHSGRPPGKHEDPLLNAARDFLDELESGLLAEVSPPLEVQISDLHIEHLKVGNPPVNEALVATAKEVLVTLSRQFDHAALRNRLQEVYQRLSNRSIYSVRRLEIELIQAGRTCLSTGKFFDDYVPRARVLCDRIYEKHDVGASRRDAYHGLGVMLIENLVLVFDGSGGMAGTRPSSDDLDMFLNDLSQAGGTRTDRQLKSGQAAGREPRRNQLPTPMASQSDSPSSSATTSPSAEQTQHPPEPPEPQQPTAGQKVEADSCCEICGYRPRGDPQWFKGSMAKHRKLQHSTEPPKIYKCPYPGCTSQYKNRPDNLRQHQIEKNHWVQGDEITPRRPSKRRKMAAEDQPLRENDELV
ncbi:uncharacterized protein P884DRAFT_277877 [Thermothelomyces heterothallicus CBS 202.75]|uniref:uncharacterized protein n=1 Tax=Thermothelomyces heterothallicus CBS 202.75 TaxID=1149848 RepID=UPI00374358D1